MRKVIRYRGYYYDADMGLYYLQSRYYDASIGRFINADGEMAEVGGNPLGYNLFAYCFNNPVNHSDCTGNWPKWVSGTLNILAGAAQIVAGAALGAFTSWTGVGAVAGALLIANGAAVITQGIGQIVNDVANSKVVCEDNIVKKGAQELGKAIGGRAGEKTAGILYDATITAASLYAGNVSLQQVGLAPIKVNINSLVNNPADEFVTVGPANGVIGQYCRSIPQNGYGKIYATPLGNGWYQIVNGHHRVAALKMLGVKTIKIYLTK